MDRTEQAGPGWPLIAALAVGGFTVSVGVTLLSPLVPAIGADLGVSDSAVGQLATVTAASAGIAALVSAPWMDRFSRRAWIRVLALLLLAGTVVSALAPSYPALLLGRAISGVGASVIFANCLAATADLFPDQARRNRVIGWLATASTLGAIVGLPIVTLVNGRFGWRWAVAALIPPVLLLLFGTRRLSGEAKAPGGSLWADWWPNYRRVLERPETRWLLLALVVQMTAWFGWLVYFGAFALRDFGIGASRLSVLLLAAGVAQMAASNLVPALVRRWEANPVGVAVALLSMANLLAVGVLWTTPGSLLAFVTIGNAAGLGLYLCTSILMLDSYPEMRGTMMSLQSASLQAGSALGSATTGVLLATLGSYAVSFRLLALLMPLAMVGLVMNRRARLRDGEGSVAAAAAD